MCLTPSATAADWFAGSGKDGALAVTGSVNEDSIETNLTAAVSTGATTLPVTSEVGFAANDLLFIVQMTTQPSGQYEFARVQSVSMGALNLTQPISRSYLAGGALVVRVKEYSEVTVAGTWGASSWNGSKGGVLVAVVRGSVTVQTGGFISVGTRGHRGAATATGTGGFRGEGHLGPVTNFSSTRNGSGGGGGGGMNGCASNPGAGGSGGHGTAGTAAAGQGGLAVGEPAMADFIYPGGGGGGGGVQTAVTPAGSGSGGAGGQGGGIIYIVAGGDIGGGGSISAGGSSGAAGGTGGSGLCRTAGGGGGAGGAVRLVSTGTVSVAGLSAIGGGGGAGQNGGPAGATGAVGRIALLRASTPTVTSNPAYSASSDDGVTLDDPFVAPAAVTDLKVEKIAGGFDQATVSALLSWTAPGDASGLGSYENFGGGTFSLRYQTGGPITDDPSFNSALFSLDIATSGVVPGTRRYALVSGLDPAFDYYFAMKTTSSWALTSNLSNSSAKTTSYIQVLPGSTGDTWGIALGDIDGDRDLDIFLANGNGTPQAQVTVGNLGDGVFSGNNLEATNRDHNGIAIADFDNDGDLDILEGNGSNFILYRNSGTSPIVTPQTLAACGTSPTSGIVAGDFDNDGDMDAMVSYESPTTAVCYLSNDGKGVFGASTIPGSSFRTGGLAVGDYDQDGDLDVLMAVDVNGTTANNARLIRNDGGGIFTVQGILPGNAFFARGGSFGDLDGDGDLDLVVALTAGTADAVYENQNGTLALKTTLADTGNTDNAVLADADGDGDLDILATAHDGGAEVYWRNDGAFSFSKTTLPTTGFTYEAKWGDLDGDGDPDAVVANLNGGADQWYRNDSSTANAAPTAVSLSAADIVFKYGPQRSTMTFKWPEGLYDGGNSSGPLNFIVAVATSPMTLSGDQLYITDPSTFSGTNKHFVVSPAVGSPLTGQYPRPAFKTWPGDAAPKHGVFVSTLAATNAETFRSGWTYYLRVQVVDAGLRRGPWSNQVSFALNDADLCQNGTVTSTASGNASDAAIWDTGIPPDRCSDVVIAAGHTVLDDGANAQVKSLSVAGTLKFPRAFSSTITVTGGDLTIQSGGTLDMGTEADPIPLGSTATLVLASGTFAGQYGLIVQNGGTFTVHGATKTPWGYSLTQLPAGGSSFDIAASSAVNWSIGDRLAIAGRDSGGGGPGITDVVTVTNIVPSGARLTVTVSPITSQTRTLSADTPIPVANLTRNAVIRSSGTSVASNTAYIRNLSEVAAGFHIANAELDDLGASAAGKYGVTFDGAFVKGVISSAAFSPAWTGVRFIQAQGNSIEGSVFLGNPGGYHPVDFGGPNNTLRDSAVLRSYNNGVNVASSGTIVSGTLVTASTNQGLYVTASNFQLIGSRVFNGGSFGVYLQAGAAGSLVEGSDFYRGGTAAILQNVSSVTFLSNRFYSNTTALRHSSAFDPLYVDNDVFSNSNGFTNDSAASSVRNARLAGNYIYGHTGIALVFQGNSTSFALVGGGLGYDRAGAAVPNNQTMGFTPSKPDRVELRGVRVNPVPVPSNFYGLEAEGSYLVSYAQNFATGTVQVYGDYAVDSGTFALTTAKPLYGAAAERAVLYRGDGHTLSPGAVSEAFAKTQLITFQFRGAKWHVDGSVDGKDMVASFTGSQSGLNIPAVNSQVVVDFTQGPAPVEGDRIGFLLRAGSADAGVRKRLEFGVRGPAPGAPASLRLGAQAAFEAVGTPAEFTLIDMAAGATYYRLLSSGTFTVKYASFTNMHGDGIWLSGDKGVSIEDAEFDLPGTNNTKSFYLTASDLTSSTELARVKFGLSVAPPLGVTPYNVRAMGAVSDLRWVFPQPASGARWGPSFEDDPVPNHIAWRDCGLLSSWASGSWSDPSVWDGGYPPTACNPASIGVNDTVTVDISSAVASTTTVQGRLQFSRVLPSTLTMVTGDLTVSNGGILDMGTGPSPILSSAALVLAQPGGGSRRGLIVQSGGLFTAQGTARTPFGFAVESISAGQSYFKISASSAVGWSDGDLVAVGATAGTGTGGVELRRINSITGTDPLVVNVVPVLGAARVWTATAPIVVANLSRNVVVVSSGSSYTADTSYVLSYATTPGGFSAAQTEFRGLGGTGGGANSEMTGVYTTQGGDLSSATVHGGYHGFTGVGGASRLTGAVVALNSANGVTLTPLASGSTMTVSALLANGNGGYLGGADRVLLAGNIFCSNQASGLYQPGVGSYIADNLLCLNTANGLQTAPGDGLTTIARNYAYGNASDGIQADGGPFAIETNTAYANGNDGIEAMGAASLLSSNTVYGNSAHGMNLANAQHMLHGNIAYQNGQSGFLNANSSATFLENYAYSNTRFGLDIRQGTMTWFLGGLGRKPDLSPAANAVGTIGDDGALGTKRLVMSQPWTAGSVSASNWAFAGDTVYIYAQNRSTGTSLFLGDYVFGGGLTFDYALRTYSASATPRLLLRGSGHSASVSGLSDANIVSQLVTVEYRGGTWHVDGSVSGADMVVTPAGVGIPVPAANTQFTLQLAEGPSPQEGDRLAFFTMAAAADANIQKKVLFDGFNGAVNNGRSRLSIPAGRTLSAKGVPGYPTVFDRLSAGSTYFTLVSSGNFAAEYSSFSNVDGDGLQLFFDGANTISLASSSFDSMGVLEGTNTYISLSASLAGAATFYGLEFGNSRSTAGLQGAYNIRALPGAISRWTLRGWRGAMGGEKHDDDLGAFPFDWSPFQPASAVSTYTAVSTGSISLQWGAGNNDADIHYEVQANTSSIANGSIASTTPVYGLSGAVSGLLPNTSYFLRVFAANQWGDNWWEAEYSPALDLGATATLAISPSTTPAGQFQIWETSSVWGWVASPAVPLSSSTYGYILEASSTDFNGTGAVYSSTTASNFVSTLAVGGPGGILERNTTYYFRVGSLNEFGAPNYTVLGTSPTLTQAVAVGAFGPVYSSSATLSWAPLASSPQPSSAEGYLLEASSTDFGGASPGGLVYSSRTPAVGAASLELSLLSPQTTYYFRVGTLNWAGVPNFVTAGSTVTGGDVTPPRALTDLRVATAALSGALLDLQWSAPGDEDDYNLLNGGEYRIQFATYAVVFATADAQVVFSTGGVLPGQAQFRRVTGLQGGSTYYFRAWTQDDAGNWSALSNGATVYLSWTLGSVGAGSKQVSAAVGPDGKHHLFYNDGGTNLVHASRLPGQAWAVENAVIGLANDGVRNAAVVDASGTIHLLYAYGSSAQHVGYTRWNGSWGGATMFAGAAAPVDAVAIAVDAAGVVHGAVTGTTGSQVRYGTRSATGVWSVSSLDTAAAGSGVSLALRPDGAPLLLYANASSKLRLLDWEGSGFTPRVIDDAVSNQQALGLVYDRDGLTAAAFKNSVDNSIRIDTAPAPSGPWSPALVLPAGAGNPYLSLALDGSGSGELLYFENSAAASLTGAGDLRRVRVGDGFTSELVGSGGGLGDNAQFPAVFMDLSGAVHAAYAGAAGGPIVVSSSAFVAGPPAAAQAPGGFGASAVYQTSVTWGWADRASDEAGYRVYGGTSAPYALVAGTGALGPGSVSFAETGLLANATYFRYAVVVTSGGFGLSVGTQAVTAVMDPLPAASTFTTVSTFGVSVAWGGASNSPGTVYEVQASTDGQVTWAFSVSTAPEAAPAADFTAFTNTTYTFRVRAVARDGTPTAYLALGSTVTLVETPASVYIDEVGSNTITASAYASSAAFTNLHLGQAGTNVAIDGAYGGWHGSTFAYRAALPSLSENHGVVALAGRLYHLGQNAAQAYGYDPASDSWSAIASMSTRRYGAGYAAAGGRIYAVGGDNGGAPIAAAERYDPVTGSWSALTPLPGPRRTRAGAVGSRVFVVGGWNFGDKAEVYEWDEASASWLARTPRPLAGEGHSLVALDGTLFALGGAAAGTAVHRYDPAGDSWSTLAPIPQNMNDAAAAALGGRIHLLGPAVYEYDPAADQWQKRPGMPSAHSVFSGAALRGRIYTTGGIVSGATNDTIEYDPGTARYFSGLVPNTAYAFKAKARNQEGTETAESPSVSTYTFAAVPSTATPTFSGVFVTSAVLQWTHNGNPAGTEFRLGVSTASDFTGAADSTSPWLTELSTVTTALTPNTSYYFRVQARNAYGNETAYAGLGSTASLAAQPGAAAAPFSPVGQTSVTVSWLLGGNPTGTEFTVKASTAADFSGTVLSEGWLSALTTTFLGLAPDTTYYWTVGARNHGGLVSQLLSLGAQATLAFPPSASTEPFHAVWVTSATVQWAANGNGGGTQYEAEASTDPAYGTSVKSGWVTFLSTTVTGLTGDATYFWRVRSRGVAGIPVDYLALGSPPMGAADPVTPRFLSVGPASASLEWGTGGNRAGDSMGAWSARTPLPAARERHAAALLGGRVYVVGGIVSGAASAEVWSAPVTASGNVGPWTRHEDLPAARESHALAAFAGRLYVLGGFDGVAKDSVYWAPISPDGSVGFWRSAKSLPAPRYKLAAAADGGWLYAIGGDNGVISQATVYAAPIGVDGSIGDWGAAAALPAARNSHGAAVSEGFVYVAGGLGAGLAGEVWSAPLAGASVGPWTAQPSLGVPVFRHALQAMPGRLLVVAGHDGNNAVATLQQAPILGGGAVGAWGTYAAMPLPRFGHGAVMNGRNLVVVGGSDGSIATADTLESRVDGTEYLTEYAQDAGYTVALASTGWRPGTALELSGLTPNTTYFSRTKSRTQAGTAGAFVDAGSSVTLAAVPATAASTFTAVFEGSMTVTWAANGNPAGTEFLAGLSTSSDFTTTAQSGWGTAVSSTVFGLSPNTTYFAAALARNRAGTETPAIFLGSTMTLAAVPQNSSFTAVGGFSFTALWSTAANPAGTRYEAEISLFNAFSPPADSSVTLNGSAQFLGLLGSSTYYMRVRALNGRGAPSAYSATTWTTTGLDISSPSVVAGLEAHPSESAGTLLALWTSPGDDGSSGDLQPGSRFYLQWAAGDPGAVAWSTANAQLSVSTGPLTPGSSSSMLVPGLPVGSNVFLRVWTLDDGGMVSEPSGTVTAWVSPFDLSRLDGTGTDAGRGVSLAVDRSGNGHATYTAGTIIQELRYMKRTGGIWSVPEGPDPGVPAADTVVAVDWAGTPQVLYRNAQTGQLRHARRTGSWAVSAVASGNLVPGGLALNATGQARISYYDAAAGDLLYAYWDGAAWQTETVDSAGDVGTTSSLALDAGGKPYVAYFDATNGNLKYGTRVGPGSWSVSTIDPAAAVVGSASALALDGIGGAYVAYLDQTSADLKVARYDGAAWSSTAVDALSTAAAVGGIALDGAGNPVVSYYDGQRGDLLFARFDGTNWSTGTVDSRGDRGAASALSVDSAGEVQVLHYNADSGDLMAARWSAGLAVPYGGNPRGGLQSPANFSGIVQSSTTIQWTWTDSAAGELGWSVYGSLSSTGPYALVASTTAIPATAGTGTNRSYSETGLSMGTTYYRYVVAVASGGYAASAVASTAPFITADVDTPVIVNSQADDTVWRRAAGTLYNVDFTDTGGSLLSSFQVRASTVPNGAGPAWVDFTDVAGSMLTDSFTADWALPAPFFAAMADGVTNYISVRVFDGAGNSSVSTDTFSVLKDTSPPSFADFQGGDSVRRAVGGTLYDVDAVDKASGLERFQYSVSLAPTAGDAAVVGWTDIPLSAGTTDFTANWAVAFASLVEDATNYVSVRAWDMAGSTAVLNDAFYVVKDTAGPRVGFTLPASAYRSALTQLSGTAADIAGVGGVEVAVQTAPIGGLWWDGGAFASGAPVWLAASGTASWTFAAVPPWTDGGSFRLVVRASDTLGNFSAPYSTADFSFDASSPTVGVTTPLDASTIAALPAISGTALDPGGAASGLSLIEARLSRVADGLFWNWTGGGWTSSPIATTPVLGSPWTVPVPEALRSNLADGASYFISARAVDGATPVNTGSFAVGSTFTWTDTTPPGALTDLTGLSGPEPGEIKLAWTAPGEDGALGSFVLGQYRIHYSTDPAAAFSTVAAQVAFSTGGVVPGAYQGRLVTGLLAGSTYHVRVFMADDSGNWSTLSNGATVLATPQPFNKITGQVMKVSSEGITAVLVEAYDASGVLVSSAYSLADGSGTFSLDDILPGVYRVQASWTAGEVTSAVWLDNIAVGSYGVQFILEVDYTLSSLTGTLASLSAQSASPSGFLTRAAESSFQESRVQLLRGGRQVAEVKPDPTGRWSISNLLPGKYAVRAYNGLEFSDALPVELGEGETQEVSFVFDPLPEAQAFAFPNPARDQTTFRFVSGLPGLEAQVSIFDIAGVMVKEIPGSAMTAKPGGLYHAVWDLTNDRGESVASGVYLFMVKVRGSNGQSGKVVKKLAVVR